MSVRLRSIFSLLEILIMSTMHAENYKITGGSFLDTFWGSCFIGSYLIKKVDLKLIKFKYRGKEVKLSDDYLCNTLYRKKDKAYAQC